MYNKIVLLLLLLIGAAPLSAASVPSLELAISAEPTTVLPNQPVTFTYTITAQDVSNVAVHEMMGDGCSRTTNARQFSCQRTATGGYVTSMAYATGDAGELITSTMATATAEIIETGIVLSVAPSSAEATVGETVTFAYTITNTGEAQLTNIALSDDGNAACAATLGELAAGAVVTHQCSVPMVAPLLSTRVQVTATPINGAYHGDAVQSVPMLATVRTPNVPTATTLVATDVTQTDSWLSILLAALLLPTVILLVKKRRAAPLLLFAAFALYAAPLKAAATCVVPNQYATIQTALNDAACAEITVAPGYYPENLHIQRNVILRGAKYQTVVDGQQLGSVIWVESGENIVIDGLILQNGHDESGGGVRVSSSPSAEIAINNTVLHSNSAEIPNGNNGWGGAVYNYHSNVTLTDCHLQGNRAPFGGGIVQHGNGKMTLVRTTLFANSADNSGGGLMVQDGEAVIEDSWIVNNNAVRQGGGFYNNGGKLTVRRSGVQANFANEGGGFYNFNGQTQIAQSSVVGHSASDGAGVLNNGGETAIEMSNISANGGNVGVGLFNRAGSISVLESSVNDNIGGFGAALYASGGKVFLRNVNVSGNRAYDGGAFYVDGTANIEPVDGLSLIDNEAVAGGGAAYVKSGVFGGSGGVYIAFNRADRGGALYADSGATVALHNGSFQFNRAEEEGGAIFCPGGFTGSNLYFLANEALRGGAIYGTNVTIGGSRSTFVGNRAVVNGGVLALSGASSIADATFENNSAGFRGGALDVSADIHLQSLTFNGNTALQGGAIYNTSRLITSLMSFSGNGANEGGAIYNRGDFNLGMAIMSGNRATLNGSAIWNDALIDINQGWINANLNAAGVHNADSGTVNFTDTNIFNHALGNCSGNIANIHNINGLIDDDGTCQP